MGESSTASILIVDDVSDNIEIVESILGRERYRLSSATRGQQAIDLCRDRAFDLVLLDVMMPEMDGFTVCRQLRRLPGMAHVPVIFLTAKTDLDSIVEGFEAGGTDYVTKPFYANELLARVRTQVRLWQTEQQLRRLNAEKDRFLNLISHELRRPFVGLQGVLSTLVEGMDQMEPAALREYARLAEDSALNLGRLLENLLRWSATQTERVPAFPQDLAVDAMLADALGIEQELFEGKGLTARNAGGGDLMVRADRQMLATVLHNLLTNAVMFSDPGGSVDLAVTAQDDKVVFSVADQGVGIPLADQDKVFSTAAYFRRTGTQGELGAGIGLVLCRELVEENGGSIWLDSAPGEGTRVYFSLPAAATIPAEA